MVIGNTHVREEFERLASEKRLAHGYLFFGPTGVGKTTFAKAFAYFLEHGTYPEGRNELHETPLLDARVLEPGEGGSIGIDAARDVKQFLWQKPFTSSYRTLIIDHADALTVEAQSALLKIAEEPPEHALLILILRDPESVMPTVLSRFHKIFFGQVSLREMKDWLTRIEHIAPKTAEDLLRRAPGSPGISWRMCHDEIFKNELSRAAAFLETRSTDRKDFLKKLLEDESFQLFSFLDALLYLIADRAPHHSGLWHSVLELRRIAEDAPLNPRIQLTNLWNSISKS